MRILFFATLLLTLSVGSIVHGIEVPDGAAGAGAVEKGDPRVEAYLVADATRVSDGDRFRVGVFFEIDPEWHIYWRNSGESGMATEIVPAPNDSLTFSALRFPAPEVFLDKSGKIATFGYSEQTLLHFDVDLEEGYPHPEVDVELEIDFLACKVECIPGSLVLKRSFDVGPRKASDEQELFNRFGALAPVSVEEAELRAELALSTERVHKGETVDARLILSSDAGESVFVEAAVPRFGFLPDAGNQVEWSTTNIENADHATLTLRGVGSPNGFESEECALRGIVHLRERRAVYLDLPFACSNDAAPAPIATTRDAPAPAPAEKPLSLAYALILALIGGMLLNLMPCVFPVLAIKVFSFVRLAHEERAKVYSHSGAYSAGIIGTMLALAGLVIAIKAAGSEVGWGFQFQEPVFVALLSTVMTVLALNLFGVFEVTVSASGRTKSDGHSLKQSFGEGVLAVVLATPCSAPFLGTAVGFAFAADTATILLVFATLGVGLALPFVVLTAVPAWTKLLPKPGQWMVTFKEVLGFALLGTSIWLVWVLGQAAGNDAIARGLLFTLVASFGAWGWGKVQFLPDTMKRRVALAVIVALIAGAGALTLRFDEPAQGGAASIPEAGELWSPWSEAGVADAQSKGNAVFVDFTADWCITCKVNENGVLASEEVVAALTSEGVVAMKADWTRRDETIRRVLARHGKAGVPLYLMYPAGGGEAVVLPELLTESMVLNAVQVAKGNEKR